MKGKEAEQLNPEDITLGETMGRLPECILQGNNMEVWTLDRMVGPDVGAAGRPQSMEMYVQGSYFGCKVRLDIPGSRKKAQDLAFSMDIDSIIWVTDKQTKGAC